MTELLWESALETELLWDRDFDPAGWSSLTEYDDRTFLLKGDVFLFKSDYWVIEFWWSRFLVPTFLGLPSFSGARWAYLGKFVSSILSGLLGRSAFPTIPWFSSVASAWKECLDPYLEDVLPPYVTLAETCLRLFAPSKEVGWAGTLELLFCCELLATLEYPDWEGGNL